MPKLILRFIALHLLKNLTKFKKNKYFGRNDLKISNIFRKHPNASVCTWTHPITSEQVQTDPNKSENLENRAKTSKKFRKTWKRFETFRVKSRIACLSQCFGHRRCFPRSCPGATWRTASSSSASRVDAFRSLIGMSFVSFPFVSLRFASEWNRTERNGTKGTKQTN